jgi:hypothetical protein
MGILLAIVLMSTERIGAAPQTAAASQGFTGTWVLDEARSALYEGQGGGSLTFVIVDQTSTLKVTRRRPDSEDSYSIPADGKPHEYTVPAGRYTRTLRRENGVLVFQISFTRAADKATLSFTERWSLSDGGRTLTVHSLFPGAAEDMKVLVRKD